MINITVNITNNPVPSQIAVYFDNVRDRDNCVLKVSAKIGSAGQHSSRPKDLEVSQDYCGWMSLHFPSEGIINMFAALYILIQSIEIVKSAAEGANLPIQLIATPRSNARIRIRQLRIFGQEVALSDSKKGTISAAYFLHEQTLKVFRELTIRVLQPNTKVLPDGKLSEQVSEVDISPELRQHVVGILFSLDDGISATQTKVCEHMLGELKRECLHMELCRGSGEVYVDMYCFEVLSMINSLAHSNVGKRFLLAHNKAIEDLVSALHLASARCQRLVLGILNCILPDMNPGQIFDGTSISIPYSGPIWRILFVLAHAIEMQLRLRGLRRADQVENRAHDAIKDVKDIWTCKPESLDNVQGIRLLIEKLLCAPIWGIHVKVFVIKNFNMNLLMISQGCYNYVSQVLDLA